MMGRSGGPVATRIAMMDRVLIGCVRCRDGTLSERERLRGSRSALIKDIFYIPNGDQFTDVTRELSRFLRPYLTTSQSSAQPTTFASFFSSPLTPFPSLPPSFPSSLLTVSLVSRRPPLMHVPVGIRSFKRHLVRGDQPEGTSSADRMSTSTSTSTQVSTSVKPLMGSFAAVGAILLGSYTFTGPDPAEANAFAGIIAWKLYSYRQRKKARAARATRFSIAYRSSEKPAFVSFADLDVIDGSRKPVLAPSIASDPYARWVPQIRSVTLPSGVTVPPVAITAPERSPKLKDECPPTPNSGPSMSPLSSPPPAYRILGLHTIPIPPTPPESTPVDIPPPTPMHRSPATTASTPVRESFDLPPVPSPRSESFQSIASMPSAPRTGLATVFAPKSLPPLMLVTSSFRPSRPDELSLSVGETLRLIKEFEDEWCLVQRVGRPDAEKGVVPRFCLEERPRIIKSRATVLG